MQSISTAAFTWLREALGITPIITMLTEIKDKIAQLFAKTDAEKADFLQRITDKDAVIAADKQTISDLNQKVLQLSLALEAAANNPNTDPAAVAKAVAERDAALAKVKELEDARLVAEQEAADLQAEKDALVAAEVAEDATEEEILEALDARLTPPTV